MHKLTRFLMLALVVLAGLSLAACGGDGSSGNTGTPGNNGNGNTNTSPTVYAPIYDAAGNGSIKIISFKQPDATPQTVITGSVSAPLTDYTAVEAYSIQLNPLSLKNFRPGLVMYIQNGKLYRYDLSDGAAGTSVQTSALTNLCDIGDIYEMDGTATDDYIAVQQHAVGETGTACTGDGYLVRISANNTANGIDLTDIHIVTTVIGTSAKTIGFLATKKIAGTTYLQFYDAQFSNPQNIFALDNSTDVSYVGSAYVAGHGGVMFLTAQEAGQPQTLYRYDPSNPTHMTAITTIPASGVTYGGADSSDFYFAMGDKLYKTSTTVATPTEQLIYTPPPGYTDLSVEGLTPDYVVVSTANTTAHESHFVSIAKAGGKLILTNRPVSVSGYVDYDWIGNNGQRVFYNIQTNDGTTTTHEAVEQSADSTAPIINPPPTNSRWFNAGFSGSTLNTVVLIDDADPHNIVLTSYDASTGQKIATLGTLTIAPNDKLKNIGFLNFLYRDGKLLFDATIQRDVGSPTTQSDSDVYFVDTATANSLHAVSATAGVDEESMYYN